jgi:hypothetical protein
MINNTPKTKLTMPLRIHQFDFYKDSTGWYIDFPEYINLGYGTKADLAMVSGADAMLDYLSQGNPRIKLTFSDKELMDAKVNLTMVARNQWGATYKTNHNIIPQVWLCNVTKLFFDGIHPSRIYIR